MKGGLPHAVEADCWLSAWLLLFLRCVTEFVLVTLHLSTFYFPYVVFCVTCVLSSQCYITRLNITDKTIPIQDQAEYHKNTKRL